MTHIAIYLEEQLQGFSTKLSACAGHMSVGILGGDSGGRRYSLTDSEKEALTDI